MPEGMSLSNFIGLSTDKRHTLSRHEIYAGDMVYVKTINSVYTLHAHRNGSFSVSGGWVDQRGISPFVTSINGCTLGGSIINITAIATCGLCIEFGNSVRTSLVRKIILIRHCIKN